MDEDLGSLIKRRMAEMGLAGGTELAKRAAAAGFTLYASRVWQLANEPLKGVPFPRMLEALAAALDVPVLDVADAALRSVGVEVPVRVNPTECGPTDGAPCEAHGTPASEPSELTLVIRLEGLSQSTFQQLVQAVTNVARQEGQRITLLDQQSPPETVPES